ncbi:MAG TPA: class I adenylate-forming enzyme family protein, partial [Gemmatimonadales bacterium]|nr:class I adenylate-forming enzyme family protein [Gemmatimonadales bacterium]
AAEEHHTGDVAHIDGDVITLAGRRKDMIIRGDFNLYPGLYEPTVERIPGVRRCAFVGVYDEFAADERVVLVVEAERGVDEGTLAAKVHRALREGPLRIDAAALPDEIVIRPIPESGRSSKIDKQALRDALAHAR